jgi:hypothetical protein
MSLDEAGEYQKMKTHLLWMASMPGAKAHASLRAKELDSDKSGIYAGIYNDVKATLLQLKAAEAEAVAGQVAR